MGGHSWNPAAWRRAGPRLARQAEQPQPSKVERRSEVCDLLQFSYPPKDRSVVYREREAEERHEGTLLLAGEVAASESCIVGGGGRVVVKPRTGTHSQPPPRPRVIQQRLTEHLSGLCACQRPSSFSSKWPWTLKADAPDSPQIRKPAIAFHNSREGQVASFAASSSRPQVPWSQHVHGATRGSSPSSASHLRPSPKGGDPCD